MLSTSGRDQPTPSDPRVASPRVYAIADVATLGLRRVVGAVAAMAESGIQWIQLRAKGLPDRDLYGLGRDVCGALAGSGVRLWINDRADLATLLPFAGVHFGQSDLPPRAGRVVVGEELWIGRSTHGVAQLLEADSDPCVDVIAVGPVFPTFSKADPDPLVGLEFLRLARGLTRKPLLAIGGITATRVRQVFDAGADGIVALSAICQGDPTENCRRLLAAAQP